MNNEIKEEGPKIEQIRAGSTATKENMEAMVEQYKIAVQMADSISQRRGTANSFYITMLTLLFAIITAFSNGNKWFLCIMSFLGCAVSFSWLVLIISYKRLNAAKYRIIKRMELSLPYKPFSDEWKLLLDSDNDKYHLLTRVESVVPIVFIAAFFLLFILAATGALNIHTLVS